MTLPNNHPVYDYGVDDSNGTNVLWIEDRYTESGTAMTVTNAVGTVLRTVSKELGDLPPVVIYRDTDGNWDRIKLNQQGIFNRFGPIVAGRENPVRNRDEAIQLAVNQSKCFSEFLRCLERTMLIEVDSDFYGQNIAIETKENEDGNIEVVLEGRYVAIDHEYHAFWLHIEDMSQVRYDQEKQAWIITYNNADFTVHLYRHEPLIPELL